MSTLALILADFHLAPRTAGHAAALPRLPALGRWLARAAPLALPGGWRPWLAQQLCAAQPGAPGLDPVLARLAAAPAAWAAAAHGVAARPTAPDRHYWFATPVHYLAGMRSVHLHPNGLLSLDRAAQEQLAASFAAAFAGSGLQLLPTGRRELLLAADAAVAGADGVHSTDPAAWLGADPSPGLPAGPGAARLRRLGSELELWLHEHPVNRDRKARGELPVTALWLWGGASAEDVQAAAAFAQKRPATAPPAAVLYADDAFGEALAQSCAAEWRPLDGSGLPVDHSRGLYAAILPTATADPVAALQRAEDAWIAPALARLGRGDWRELLLVAGERGYRLTRAGRWRVWRREAAWWQVLAATPEE